MTFCLICQSALSLSPSFSQLFLLKEEPDRLCSGCSEQFESISDRHCYACFKDGCESLCTDCRDWQEKGKGVRHRSLYRYNEAMRTYFSRYKFQGDYRLRQVFAKDIRLALTSYEKNYQVIPIPISRERWLARGFNQVTGLLEAAGISYQELLEKKEVQEQSAKSKEERLKLVQPFFLVAGSSPASRVLLVDDIYTTGATLQLAGECLRSAGVREIQTFSLAR